ncbi:uncharacterized protein CCOS01_03165 [Colletotrichum costaricense]|uniref:Uncharacterized protein n=1 Tax=Colletotrichum costaricense TaxID=1209916 RepID=A0AAJ0E5H0_9PEZI|nr:uncharacterized protein CCOS01_03165 [Colletotrichum costaricense]KAK1534413.1 hypothetical protein CCOS01_03165 [Colletotrichum costaricense]
MQQYFQVCTSGTSALHHTAAGPSTSRTPGEKKRCGRCELISTSTAAAWYPGPWHAVPLCRSSGTPHASSRC